MEHAERSDRSARENLAERLPPGQFAAQHWPVVHIGEIPEIDLATWSLRVYGAVEHPLKLGWSDLLRLERREITTDIHCVVRWSRFNVRFAGVPWNALERLVRPAASAKVAMAYGYGDYRANIPLAALAADDTVLAYEADGAALTPEHGWPVRLIVPSRYLWKSVKWLQALELLEEDEPGLWEQFGFHNNASPWNEERAASDQPERLYGFGSPPRKRIYRARG